MYNASAIHFIWLHPALNLPLRAELSARPDPVRSEEAPKPKAARTATLEVVTEDDGLPLPGATVFIRGKGGRTYTWEGATDRPEWGTLVLLVQASGLAWAVHEVAVTPETPPQVIRLTRRRQLESRVVDAQGRPVAGVVVASDREFLGGLLGWEAATDKAGRFVWYDAPTTGEVYLKVFEPSHQLANQTIARPQAGEVTITLPHP